MFGSKKSFRDQDFKGHINFIPLKKADKGIKYGWSFVLWPDNFYIAIISTRTHLCSSQSPLGHFFQVNNTLLVSSQKVIRSNRTKLNSHKLLTGELRFSHSREFIIEQCETNWIIVFSGISSRSRWAPLCLAGMPAEGPLIVRHHRGDHYYIVCFPWGWSARSHSGEQECPSSLEWPSMESYVDKIAEIHHWPMDHSLGNTITAFNNH